LKVKLFADGADLAAISKLRELSYIQGFTTNPTLMRQAGVADYTAFARDVICAIRGLPVSFEVFADEFDEMERQARIIASWGSNVYVKIPVMNTKRIPALDLIRRLSRSGIKVNVTAVMTLEQVRDVSEALSGGAPSCVSVFAGRIADTGRDPVPLMVQALSLVQAHSAIEMIWASPREIFNVFQADQIGCDIITVTKDILTKLQGVGKDLNDFSVETIQMFYRDALKSGFSI
jgi:transaldolase